MNPSNGLRNEKTEAKGVFKNLKSDYFLRKLFYNLLKKKSLDIIKYNNNIKERMNISIKDYKEYSEIYSSIEIEIKPVKNKYGEFINMNENKIYYHIYFNDNKEEIKRNYFNENDNVSKFKIIIDYQVKSFKKLFYYCKCIEYIYFKKFYRNNIDNMNSMFYGCSSLKELNLSNFNTNTNNVTNMKGMLYGCSSLEELNLSNFNTNNVTNMVCMFYGCYSLK
jgi:surface protein